MWGSPWERHQGVGREVRKGQGVGAKQQQGLVGLQLLVHRLQFVLQLKLSPGIPGELCAGVGTPGPLPDRQPKAMVGQMPRSPFPGWALSVYMCSCETGEVFMFEDLVFTTAEKTAPNFFPEILIPPCAASSQGPNHWGDAGSGDGGNDGERGMAAVLSSDLTQCSGVPPWGAWYCSGS